MPFKIIQTEEKEKRLLTVVPDQWEKNNIVFWPKPRKLEKLRKDENSVVDFNKCTPIKCTVKRRNIPTFRDGEAEIDIMSQKTETDTDIENQEPPKKKPLLLKSFNNMAYDIQQAELPSPPTAPADTERTSSDVQNINQDKAPSIPVTGIKTISLGDEIIPLIEIDSGNNSILEELKRIREELKSVKEELKSVKEESKSVKEDIQTVTTNQTILYDSQNNIIGQLSQISTKQDEYIKQSLKAKPNLNPSLCGGQICDLKDLEEFERKLDVPDLRDQLYRQYSVILSHGVGKGLTNAYCLVDVMFHRLFFTQCSWTGNSKGGATKICFKGYTKTINFFFNIVHESDETFPKTKLTKFFKTVLRNARYRAQNEQRTSTQRQKKSRTKNGVQYLSQDNLQSSSSNSNERERETTQLPNVNLCQWNPRTVSAGNDQDHQDDQDQDQDIFQERVES